MIRFHGIRIAESDAVSKLVKRLVVLGLSLLTAATVGLSASFRSPARSTASRPPGLDVPAGRRGAGGDRDRAGERRRAGGSDGRRPHPPRRRADGVVRSQHPERQLARKPFPHPLVVLSRSGEIRGVSLGEPSRAVRRDLPLPRLRRDPLPGHRLFTIARERTGPALIFWCLCLASFAIYVLTPAGPRDVVWKLSWLTEDFYRAFLPALLLHFFLIFPRPIRARSGRAAALRPGRRVPRRRLRDPRGAPLPRGRGVPRGLRAFLVRLLRGLRLGRSSPA